MSSAWFHLLTRGGLRSAEGGVFGIGDGVPGSRVQVGWAGRVDLAGSGPALCLEEHT